MELRKPTQCALWKNPEGFDFELVKTFVESSHFDRSIVRCKECGQLYFYEFYEHINFFGGNDDMYCTWIPVENDEIEMLSGTQIPIELLQFSPRLQWDFVGGEDKPPRWVGK